jgi:hypothetical protein
MKSQLPTAMATYGRREREEMDGRQGNEVKTVAKKKRIFSANFCEKVVLYVNVHFGSL